MVPVFQCLEVPDIGKCYNVRAYPSPAKGMGQDWIFNLAINGTGLALYLKDCERKIV